MKVMYDGNVFDILMGLLKLCCSTSTMVKIMYEGYVFDILVGLLEQCYSASTMVNYFIAYKIIKLAIIK